MLASNDTIVDRYGTVITVEALMRDWWPGYQQHRTLSLQHNIEKLRGIQGEPNVGLATRVDFAPQLEVEARILHPQALVLVQQGKVRSASLEFVPLEVETRAGKNGKRVEVYHRLSSEPEHCGLSLVDLPGVPGADILSIRTLPALWAAAVVDPRVLNGEITDPEQVRQLAWLPHHDTRSHAVDEAQLARALEDLESGRVQVPAFASLSQAQVVDRARAHLERHTTSLRLGRTSRAEPLKEGEMTDQERAATAPGTAPVEARAANEDQEARGLLARLFGRGNVTIMASDAAPTAELTVEERVEPEPAEQPAAPAPAAPQRRSARDEWLQARTALLQVEDGHSETEARALAQEQLDADYGLQARLAAAPAVDAPERADLSPEIRALLRRPEDPMAAIASGLRVRSQRMDGEQLLAEVLLRTVVPQAAGQRPSSRQLTEAYSMMREAGISERALTIEANGTVIYEDMARQFVVRPEPDVVFRNHMSSVPMGGVSKRTFPRFDRAGITHQWNRSSTGDITPSDPTTDTFAIEVAELNSKVNVADSFQLFNAQGASFVSQNLLPAIRGAAQYEEDRVFFLGTGVSTDPVEFKGLMTQPGVTSVAASGNGDAFTLTVLNSLLRGMPVRYRNQVSRLAFYLPVSLADDFVDIISDRATLLGDAYLGAGSAGAGPGTTLGPTPVGYYRRIPVYAVPQLPDNQTQGSSSGIASTIFLVHRDIPVIGDALTIRIEPFRAENFITKLQLQQWVGLGYQWSDAIVKRVGVLAKAP